MLELATVSLLNGVVYGLLLFMLTSGLTLIFSMMGVLNFAHASVFMLGAYLSYQFGKWVGFWPALVIAPLLCGLVGAAIERYGLRHVHRSGHVAEILFTFGLAYVLEELVTMIWGRNAVANNVPAAIDFSLFSLFGSTFPAYKGLMMAISGALIASMLIGIVQTFAVAIDYSLVDLFRAFGVAITRASPMYELLAVKLATAAPIVPYLLLVLMLIVRPRGLLGTRDV